MEEIENYLHSEVLLPQNGAHMRTAKVIGRSKDTDGFNIGEYNSNPLLDTRVYDVMFPDGAVDQYAANVIADNLLSQVDEEGHPYMQFEKIIGHRVDGTESQATQHTNVNKWVRHDKNAKHFVTTSKGGPRWKHVTRRQTFNNVNGKLLEDIIVTNQPEKRLNRPLPKGVITSKLSSTTTVIQQPEVIKFVCFGRTELVNGYRSKT